MASMTTAEWRPALPANPVVAVHAGKVSAVLAVVCFAVHVPLLAAHLTQMPGRSMLMAAASVACIPCVKHLWGAPTIRVWATAGGLAGFMLLVHLTIIQSMSAMTSDGTAMGGTSGGHHIAGRPVDPATIHQSGSEVLTYLATGLAFGQACLAAVIVVISVKRRDRHQVVKG